MKSTLFTQLLSKSRNGLVACSLLSISVCTNLHAQTISSIAGTGTIGSTGDGAAATAATLSAPWGVVTDAAGNIYIADESANCIRKINTAGIISTIAGTGTAGYSGDGGAATAATLSHPYDVGVDAAGNVYIADYSNNRVRKINTSGIISTYAGTGSPTFSGDGGPATAAGFTGPSGLKIDAAGNVYINLNGSRISKINASGMISTFAGMATTGYSGDGGPATAAKLNNPVAMALDASGNAYIVDQANQYIRKVDPAGIISTICGTGSSGYSGDGGPATAAKLNSVWGIATDAVGNIYLGDHYNYCIRKISTSGVISTYAGTGLSGYSGDGGPATAAYINAPWGICTDAIGNLYIADGGNYRVRKVTSTTDNNPHFLDGGLKAINVCENSGANAINTLLSILDVDVAQTETWTALSGPYHGSVSLTGTEVSTGSNITPSGFTYTPATGYRGLDTFKVVVNDGALTDTAIVYVTIDTVPAVSAITKADGNVCKGNSITLSDATSYGVWSTAATIASVSSTGMVAAIDIGTATISYTVSNGACKASATTVVKIIQCMDGPDGIERKITLNNDLNIYPNPGNGTFTILITGNQERHISITDLVGMKLQEFTLDGNTLKEIKLDAPAGIYLLSAISKTGERTVAKILVQ